MVLSLVFFLSHNFRQQEWSPCRELKGNADAVEFCNIPPYLNLLIAASYTLQKGPVPVCVGGLHVFSLEKDNRVLQELQVIETNGTFDIKSRGSILGLLPYLGQASADGSLRPLFFARTFALSSTTLWEFHFSHLSAVMLSSFLSVSQFPVSVGNDFVQAAVCCVVVSRLRFY